MIPNIETQLRMRGMTAANPENNFCFGSKIREVQVVDQGKLVSVYALVLVDTELTCEEFERIPLQHLRNC